MKDLFCYADTKNQELLDRYDAVFDSWDICVLSGRLHQEDKVSLQYINKAFMNDYR